MSSLQAEQCSNYVQRNERPAVRPDPANKRASGDCSVVELHAATTRRLNGNDSQDDDGTDYTVIYMFASDDR